MDEEGFLSKEAIREYFMFVFSLLHFHNPEPYTILLHIPQLLIPQVCPLLLLLIHHQTGVSILLPCSEVPLRQQLYCRGTQGCQIRCRIALAFDESSTTVEPLKKSLENRDASKPICRPLSFMFNLCEYMCTSSLLHYQVLY